MQHISGSDAVGGEGPRIDADLRSVQADLPSAESELPRVEAAVANAPYPWIIHPVVDLLFCCGGFPLIIYFFFLAGARVGVDTVGGFTLWFLTIVGIHCFQDAHSIASWYRIVRDKETFNAARVYFISITVGALLLFVAVLFNSQLLRDFLRIYLMIGFYHWLAQSYGVTLIYCFKRGYRLSLWEKRILHSVYLVLSVYAGVRLVTVAEFGTLDFSGFKVPFLPLLPPWTLSLVQVVFEIVILLFVGMVIRKYVREKSLFPVPALLLMLTSVWFYSLAPGMFALLAYFIGAFYHGSQSWCVTTSFWYKHRGLPSGITYSTIWKIFFRRSTWIYLSFLFVISELMNTVMPRVFAPPGSLPLVLAAVAGVFSTHHFLCDAAIWKLKNPAWRKTLIM